MTASRLVLVRHAEALGRGGWTAPDAERPLTPKGERQAEALAALLEPLDPLAALTSPARRCADTLGPLAGLAGLELCREALLAEGTPPKEALAALLDALASLPPATGGRRAPVLVACSHGDVIDGIASILAAEGVPLEAGEGIGGPVVLETPKAARWEIAVDAGTARSARLVGPPGRSR